MNVKIGTLLREHKCFSNANASHVVCQANFFTSGTGSSSIQKALLKGCLKPVTQSDLRPIILWQWCLQDETGTIEAMLNVKDVHLAGKHILCTKWNFIYRKDINARWLEISDFTPIDTCSWYNVTTPSSIVDVPNALKLARIRKEINLTSVSIYGQVYSITEIFRYRGKEMCIIELQEGNVFLKCLIQKNEILHWRLLLSINEQYVFCHLRASTAFKSTENEVVVFVPTSNSTIIEPPDDLQLMSAKEYIESIYPKSEDFPSIMDATEDEMGVENGRCVNKQLETCSYTGTITSCEHRKYGVFEIDNKIRLYTRASIALHEFAMFHPGIQITTDFVHLKHNSDTTNTEMFACPMSSFEINKFSDDPQNTECQDISNSLQFDGTQELQAYINCNLLCQGWIFDTYFSLLTKLSPNVVRPVDVGQLLKQLVMKLSPESADKELHFVPSMLSSTHCKTCPFLMKEIPDLPCMETIDIIRRKVENFYKKSTTNQPFATEKNEQSNCWNSFIVSKESLHETVVVGQIIPNKRTGLLQIADQTGSINIVGISKEEIKNQSGMVHNPPSDLINVGDLGSLIAIHDYDVVGENFLHYKSIPSGKNVEDFETRIYIRFSMKDVVCFSSGALNRIGRPLPTNNVKWVFEGPSNKKSKQCDQIVKSISGEKSAKQSDRVALAQTFSSNCDINEDSSLTKDTCDVKDSICNSSVIQSFVVVQKDNLNVKFDYGRSSSPKLSFTLLVYFVGDTFVVNDNDQQVISSEAIASFVKKDIQGGDKENRRSMTQFGETRQHVVLSFEETAVKWYHLLHVGSLYSLVKKEYADKTCFKTKFASEMLKMGVQRSRATHFLHVSSDVEIIKDRPHRLCHSRILQEFRVNGLFPVINPVREIANDSAESKLVSVFGIIKERSHRENQPMPVLSCASASVRASMRKIGAGMPFDKSIRIFLQDVDHRHSTVPVYINPYNMSYPLGLLPGTKVIFYKLEKRTSGQGKLYLQYTSASSYNVLGQEYLIQEQDYSTTVQLGVEKPEFLTSLLCSDTVSSPQQVLVSVQRILKIVFTNACETCHQLVRVDGDEYVQSCICISPKTRLSAKASFMIDDGSCNALAHCKGDVVYKLLALSTSQRDSFETLVRKEGEITFDKESSQSHATSFLKLLCTSGSVLRRVIILVNKKVHSKSWQSVTLEVMKYRQIGSGERHFETLCLPIMHLDCLALQELDPTAVATALLYR